MKRNVFLLGAGILVLQLVMSGCAGTSRVADANEPTDIRWLTNRLQDEGVYVVERGSPNPTIASDKSSRLVLNQREVLDVYDFGKSDRAQTVATEFAAFNPQNDVFLKDSLVIIRYSRRDTGLNQVLYQLLGAAI
jgi:hypothetical protein